MDIEKFENCKAAIKALGGSDGIQAQAKALDELISKHKDQTAALDKARRELEGLPSEAIELVRQGKGTSDVEARVITLRARVEVAGQVLAQTDLDLEAAWVDFSKAYDIWMQGEIKKSIAEVASGFRAEAEKACQALLVAIEKVQATEARLGPFCNGDLAGLKGMELFGMTCVGGLRVKLGGAALIQFPKSDTGKGSARLYGHRRHILENSDPGTGAEFSPAIVEIANGLALLSVLPSEARRVVGDGKRGK